MPSGNPSDTQLFPKLVPCLGEQTLGLLSNPRYSSSSRRYTEGALKVLDEISEREDADIAERDAAKERGGFVTREVDLGPLYRDLRQAWCRVDSRLSKEILDGTVDGFPELWVTNGHVITKTRTYEGEDKGSVVETVPLAVDYFQAARESLKEAAASDLIWGSYRRITLSSALSEATSYLYSALKFKAKLKDFHPVKLSAAVRLIAVMVAILFAVHFLEGLLPKDSLIAALLVIVQFAGALLTLAVAYGTLSSVRSDAELSAEYKEKNAALPQTIGKHYANAYKLLRYYQLWRENLAQRVEAGYTIEGLEGKDILPRCLKDMDAVIAELQSVLNRTSALC